ncbi:hypothetical protein ACRQ5B_07365 [Pseudarthrobacter sp. L19]|uniref:hypothetical protein n=1 Tax=Pseudarthrobacter sp. L19 TaxID=3423951 RepID=UPI003D7B9B54
MVTSLIERPALLVSELGLLLLGVVLGLVGFVNFVAAFTADRLAFVGAFIFLIAGVWCLLVSLIAALGRPRSTVGRATLVAVGWLGATYPLGGVLTNLGSGAFIMALPIAGGAVALALVSIRKKGAANPSV